MKRSVGYMEKKKKGKRIILISAILLTVNCLINRILLLAAEQKAKKIEKGEFYQWRLGKIHYTVKGKGKPILLVHGIGAGSSLLEWKKNQEELSKSYRVYALDLLGFGFSDKPKTTYTTYLYVSLILDFIQNVIQTPVCAVGSSLSADFLVMSCHMNAKWFKKMILIEPTGLTSKMAQNKDISLRRLLESPMIGTAFYHIITSKAFCKSFLEKNIFFAKELASKEEVWKDYYIMSHIGGYGTKYPIASFITGFMNLNIEQALKECKIPLYFVWGENAILNPADTMEQFEILKPRSKYILFEQTRQLPHYENATEFNHLVKEFFK